ncbi:MAG: PfkB family carbohydrate kinase [Castellaniella sp.]|uniref:PfkB family carbohydrate kinase n=1 Tax=Castellaniella sp. TaxID=1955812 RepID=UPI003C760DC0
MSSTLTQNGKPYLIAVGAICNTTIFRVDQVPALPAKTLANDMRLLIDGMAASAACAFARLGGHAEMWARVGDDDHGQEMRRALSADGLDTRHLHTVPGSQSSQSVIIVDGKGDRLVTAFHDPRTDASPAWLPLERLASAGLLHCDVRWVEGAEAALKAARACGIPSMVDGDVAPLEVLDRLIPLARYAIFSDAGLLAYARCEDVEQALMQVGSTHDGHVGASCGALGYYWYEEGKIRHVAAPVVDVVDTLAAGDVFHGAFALGLLEGRDIEACARFACAAASLKCTQFGGRLACPSRDEVEALLAL